MLRKHKQVAATGSGRATKVPLVVGVLALLILLATMDVASAQTSTAGILTASVVQSALGASLVGAGGKGNGHAVVVPPKPIVRSPHKPPWVPGPPPWAPGKPDWVPGPPPWASSQVVSVSSRFDVTSASRARAKR